MKKRLLEDHQSPCTNAERQERIAELGRRHEQIEQQMAETKKEVSRLGYLIEQEHACLCVAPVCRARHRQAQTGSA